MVTRLMEILLEYRAIITEESKENQMSCIVNLFDFYQHIKWVRKIIKQFIVNYSSFRSIFLHNRTFRNRKNDLTITFLFLFKDMMNCISNTFANCANFTKSAIIGQKLHLQFYNTQNNSIGEMTPFGICGIDTRIAKRTERLRRNYMRMLSSNY